MWKYEKPEGLIAQNMAFVLQHSRLFGILCGMYHFKKYFGTNFVLEPPTLL